MKSDDTMMDSSMQIQRRGDPPWKDWEDQGGFDDEEALMGVIASKRSASFQEQPWYYEKKQANKHQPIMVSIQMSFL